MRIDIVRTDKDEPASDILERRIKARMIDKINQKLSERLEDGVTDNSRKRAALTKAKMLGSTIYIVTETDESQHPEDAGFKVNKVSSRIMANKTIGVSASGKILFDAINIEDLSERDKLNEDEVKTAVREAIEELPNVYQEAKSE